MNGYVCIDKPAGSTSFDVVRTIRRSLPRGTKVGHCGTLDPFATGLLVVLVGGATRMMRWLVGHDKRYLLEVRLGATSTTDDADGVLTVRTTTPTIDRDALNAAVGAIAASTEQVPPAVSALHVDGQRAYARARRGEHVELEARPVVFRDIQLVDVDEAEGRVRLDVRCSSGCYMRSLARDLGVLLGSGGHATALRRLEIGRWRVDDAVALDGFDPARDTHPLEELLAALPTVVVSDAEARSVIHGRAIEHSIGSAECSAAPSGSAYHAIVDGSGRALAIAELHRRETGQQLQPRVVFGDVREVAWPAI